MGICLDGMNQCNINWNEKKVGEKGLYENGGSHEFTVHVCFPGRSVNNTYAKQNGGKYNFYMDGENAIPDDQVYLTFGCTGPSFILIIPLKFILKCNLE